MATYTVEISGSAVANGARNRTISDAAISRIIAWQRAIKPLTPDNRTDAQVLVLWQQDLELFTVSSLKEHEQAVARQTAHNGVTPIAFT